jgi:adenylate cyclase
MVDENSPNLNSSVPERADERPWPDAIRAQLNRILVQPHFIGADDEVRLLRHLIEHAKDTSNEAAQETTITNHLFRNDRDETEALSHLRLTYDELRKALDEYFGSRGRNDPVIFDLAKQTIRLTIKASVVQLELDEIEADAAASAVLPANKQINRHAIIAMGIMTLASIIYFFGIDRLTIGPAGPESITDVGPAKQKLISLAVLPFLSKDVQNLPAHYAKAISIELVARLGRNKSLRIIAPATMLTISKTHQSLTDIAEITDVRYVLSGNFLRAENKTHLAVALYHAEDGNPVWQKTYPHDPKAMSSLYSSITQLLSVELFSKKERASQKSKHGHSDDKTIIQKHAYATYLKARSSLTLGTYKALAQSIILFRSAINDDPGLARAHSGLAASLTKLAGYGIERISPQPSMKEARKAAANALRLNEYYAEPYVYLGEYRTTVEWNWKNAEQVYVYAIQFNPSDADARLFYSRFLESHSRRRSAIDQAERAHILNPRSPLTHANRAWQYLQAKWFTRARKNFKTIREKYPTFWAGPWGLGHYYWRKDDLEDAIDMFKIAVSLDPQNTMIQASLGHLYGIAKQTTKARDVLAAMMKRSQSLYVSPVHIAMVHAGLGDLNQTFNWLEKAFLIKARGLAWVNVIKEFQPLHDDPRYHTLLKRLKLRRLKRKRRPQPS